jgi:DNA-binding PadR family transcriptional regulator
VSRLFGPGQLKLALLQVAAELGPANGYAIMHALDERVGGSWRPSPGAIYPALLALEDAGLMAGRDLDGSRSYEPTARGRALLEEQPDVVRAAAARARRDEPATTVGEVLDRLVARAPRRGRRLHPPADQLFERRLDAALRQAVDDALAEAMAAAPPGATAGHHPTDPTIQETPDG